MGLSEPKSVRAKGLGDDRAVRVGQQPVAVTLQQRVGKHVEEGGIDKGDGRRHLLVFIINLMVGHLVEQNRTDALNLRIAFFQPVADRDSRPERYFGTDSPNAIGICLVAVDAQLPVPRKWQSG